MIICLICHGIIIQALPKERGGGGVRWMPPHPLYLNNLIYLFIFIFYFFACQPKNLLPPRSEKSFISSSYFAFCFSHTFPKCFVRACHSNIIYLFTVASYQTLTIGQVRYVYIYVE